MKSGIAQFIPISEVDPVYFANSYLPGCGSGAAKAYHLLNAAMNKKKRAALAKFVMRGKNIWYWFVPMGMY